MLIANSSRSESRSVDDHRDRDQITLSWFSMDRSLAFRSLAGQEVSLFVPCNDVMKCWENTWSVTATALVETGAATCLADIYFEKSVREGEEVKMPDLCCLCVQYLVFCHTAIGRVQKMSGDKWSRAILNINSKSSTCRKRHKFPAWLIM